MDYRDNRQRWAESHQVVHFYAGQWCTFTPALTSMDICSERLHQTAIGAVQMRHRVLRDLLEAQMASIRRFKVGDLAAHTLRFATQEPGRELLADSALVTIHEGSISSGDVG